MEFGLRFESADDSDDEEEANQTKAGDEAPNDQAPKSSEGDVVSLDSFRKP